MSKPAHKTAKLPHRLLQELGLQDASTSSVREKRTGPGLRKERRKAARVQKKSTKLAPTASRAAGRLSRNLRLESNNNSSTSLNNGQKTASTRSTATGVKPIKSILKKAKAEPEVKSSQSQLSRGAKDCLAADDAEIEALEKALGIKGKKNLPNSFKEDGLDTLLDGLDDSFEEDKTSTKRKRVEEDEWLQAKRRKALENVAVDKKRTSMTDLLDQEFLSDTDEQYTSDDDDRSGRRSFESFDISSQDELPCDSNPQRTRENPYIAPQDAYPSSNTGKYVPPSKRQPSVLAREDLQLLHRQIHRLLNQLSESNIVSILKAIEKQYGEHARQDVSNTLLDVLLAQLSNPKIFEDTFIILHAGLIAAIYKVIGMDFGAQIVQRIVTEFDSIHSVQLHGDESGKKLTNLISLLSQLFNFQVIGSNLMYDYIEIFLKELSEINTELLLKIIRNSGPQLRQDNPSSLKNIILQLHNAVSRVDTDKLSVRTHFMIETMNDLKNNRIKKGLVNSEIMSEHIIRIKKTLGSLNTGTIKASEPLGFRLLDIRDSDKRGEWWRVGASYKDQAESKVESLVEREKLPTATIGDNEFDADGSSVSLVELAREQRMNTDVRRSIFMTLLSDADPEETYLRLLKLSTKKQLEIPKVLVHCACMEKAYNPYYTEIAKRLCSSRKLKTAFQFSLWDAFRNMGEGWEESVSEGEDEKKDEMETRNVVSLAKLFGTLVSEGSLGLAILKTLNMAYLRPKTKIFLEVFFIRVLIHSQRESYSRRDEKSILKIFLNSKDTPSTAKGIQYFLKKVVARTDIAGNEQDAKTITWASKVAVAALIAKTSNSVNDG